MYYYEEAGLLFVSSLDRVCIHTCTICQQLLNTVCIISIIKYREYIEVVYVTRNIKYNLKQSFEVHPTKVAAIGHESIFHFSLYSEWQQPKKPFLLSWNENSLPSTHCTGIWERIRRLRAWERSVLCNFRSPLERSPIITLRPCGILMQSGLNLTTSPQSLDLQAFWK